MFYLVDSSAHLDVRGGGREIICGLVKYDIYPGITRVDSVELSDDARASVAGEDFARRVADGTIGMRNYRKVQKRAAEVMPVDTSMIGRTIDVIAWIIIFGYYRSLTPKIAKLLYNKDDN